MLCPTRRRVLISAATTAAVLGAGAARADRGPTGERPRPTARCTAQLVPSSVTAGRPDTRILVETDVPSAEGPPDVRVPAESGIRVRDVREDVSPGSWVLLLDLTDARAGAWEITLRTDGVRCGGQLRIRSSGRETPGRSPRAGPGRADDVRPAVDGAHTTTNGPSTVRIAPGR